MSENTKYKMLQAFHQMMMCIIQAYCSYYLFGYNFSATEAGLLSALAGLAAMFLQPVMGNVADHSRRFNWKRLLVILAFACEISLLIVFISRARTVTGFFYAAAIALVNMMFPMINAASFYYSSLGIHVDFGAARGIGSLSYALLSLLLGRLTMVAGRPSIPAAGMITMGTMLAVSVSMPFYTGKKILSGNPGIHRIEEDNGSDGRVDKNSRLTGKNAGHKDTGWTGDEYGTSKKSHKAVSQLTGDGTESPGQNSKRKGFMRHYRPFMIMVLACLLALSFHNMYNFYLINIIERAGGDTGQMGVTLFIMAMLELPVMFSMSRLVRKISPAIMLTVSCFCFAIKGIIYVHATNMGAIYIAGLFQIVTFALIASASAYYTEAEIDPEDRVTGQAYMSLIFSGSTAIGNLLGGWLIDQVGLVSMLEIGVGMAVCSGILAVISIQMEKEEKRKAEIM